MIPFIQDGKHLTDDYGRRRFLKTKADEELKECDHLKFAYAHEQGHSDRAWPVWKFIEAYLRIQNKSGSRSVWALNDAQILIYKEVDKQMAGQGYVRLNLGKGRQMGSSTIIAGIGFARMVTTPGFHVGILADTQEKGRGLLEKYRFFLRNLPEALRAVIEGAKITDNADKIAIDFGGGMVSMVQVIVANENAGASYTFQMLHESEVALWENIGATILALEQTVASEKGTLIFRETTARGPNEWKSYYEEGKTGRSPFRSMFLAWYLDKGYRKPYDGHALNSYERKLKESGVHLDSIQWWHEKWHECNCDYHYMKQEYPSFESEMWEGTSDSPFDAEIVARRKEEVEKEPFVRGYFDYDEPEGSGIDGAIEVRSYRFIEDPYGPVTLFVKPKPGHPYALSNDPSKEGKDFYATQVFDASNLEQVATYHSDKATAKEAAFQCHFLGLHYGRPVHTGERNATKEYLHWLKRLGDEVVTDQSNSEAAKYLQEIGWATTTANRVAMIGLVTQWLLETGGRSLHDYETLCEMEMFQYKGGKAQAIGSAHDDLVMALCGLLWCYQRGDFPTDVEEPRSKNGEDYFDRYMRRRDKGRQKELFQQW